MNERNKLIIKTLQVYGYRKIALFGNFQHLKFLDGDVRLQLDCFIKMKAQNSFNPQENPLLRPGLFLMQLLRITSRTRLLPPIRLRRDGVYQAIGQIPVPQMWDFFEVCGVSKDLYRNYLKKKDEYFQEIGEPEEKKRKRYSVREN